MSFGSVNSVRSLQSPPSPKSSEQISIAKMKNFLLPSIWQAVPFWMPGPAHSPWMTATGCSSVENGLGHSIVDAQRAKPMLSASGVMSWVRLW